MFVFHADATRSEIIGLGIAPRELARVGGGNSGFQGGMEKMLGRTLTPQEVFDLEFDKDAKAEIEAQE